MKNKQWLKEIKAVGFDLDGTLYKKTKSLNDYIGEGLVRKVYEKVGGDFEEVKKEYLKKRIELRSNTLTLNSFGLDGEKVFQALFDEIKLEDYMGKDERLIEMIEKLKKRYDLFIVSNGAKRQMLEKMEVIGLREEDFNPLIGCYEHDDWVKPSSKAFEVVIDELGIGGEEVLFVGDRAETDIEGANRVGMRTALVWGESKKADISLPTVYDVGDLLL